MLRAALIHGPLARADIARVTGLSSAAVTRAVKPLLDAGYLQSAPQQRPADGEWRLGRPSSPLSVRADQASAVGIKVTGDELIGVVTDLLASIRVARRAPLADRMVDAVVAQIAVLHAELVEATPEGLPRTPAYVGLSLSGDIDHAAAHVRYSPFLGWRDVPIGALVAAATGATVLVENDVKALAVAEQWAGLGTETETFALVTIGAGIGCALVIGDSLVRGAHSVAGEIGHLPLGDTRVTCHCGARGCVEAVASTTAILDAARVATEDPRLTLDRAVELARQGNERVAAVFAEAGRVIGLALASVANLVGPERIVVSGESVSSYDLFEQAIRDAFTLQAFGATRDCAIHVQPLPFEEWARGASAVAIQELVLPASTRRISATGGWGR